MLMNNCSKKTNLLTVLLVLTMVTLVSLGMSAAVADDYGFIVNGGFEDGIEPWEVNDLANIELVSGISYAGENSLLVKDRINTGSGPMQLNHDVKVEVGDVLFFSVKVMYDSPTAPDTKNFNITFRSGDWTTFEIMGTAEMTKGVWGTIEGEFVVGSEKGLVGTESIGVFVETPWVADPDPDLDLMDFYIDEIMVFKA